MTSLVATNSTEITLTSSEFLSTTAVLQVTTEDGFDVRNRLVTGFVALIVYLAVLSVIALGCWLYKSGRGRDGRNRRSAALSIAEYCNRSYNTASTSHIDDAIFSVRFSRATDDVRLPTSLRSAADDRQRLDADFNAAPASQDRDDICPYATFTEIEHLQTSRKYRTREGDGPPSTADDSVSSDTAMERRPRTRPRKSGTTTNDVEDIQRWTLEPQRIAANDDVNALYAQPHRFIPRDSSTDNQHLQQSQQLFSSDS